MATLTRNALFKALNERFVLSPADIEALSGCTNDLKVFHGKWPSLLSRTSLVRVYTLQAVRLAVHNLKLYKGYVDPNDWLCKHHYTTGCFDFLVAPAEGHFCFCDMPLDPRVIAHPANIIVNNYQAPAQGAPLPVRFKELVRRVKEFNSAHSRPRYPKHLITAYKRNLSDLASPKAPSSYGKTILGLDPGTMNFAYFVGVFTHNSEKADALGVIEPKDAGLLPVPLDKLTGDLAENIARMSDEFQLLIELHQPEVISIERYQSRGFVGGITEIANVLIGMLMGISIASGMRVESFQAPTASTWKNKVNKQDKKQLEQIYKRYHPLPPHIIDAFMLAVHAFPSKQCPIQSLVLDTAYLDSVLSQVSTIANRNIGG